MSALIAIKAGNFLPEHLGPWVIALPQRSNHVADLLPDHP
jgi:hypothetical protein